jgi:hypothetical protein
LQFNNKGAFGGASTFTYDGTNVQIGATGALRFADTDSSNYVAFKSPSVVPANVTWTLPGTDGTDGQTMVTNGSGTLTWATPTLTPVVPSNYALPEVTGTTTVGQALNCSTGGWNGYPAPSYQYQWVRGASTNVGTNSSSYTLVDADYNDTIKCTVKATNSAGNASATSVETSKIAGTVPGAPTIGTATAGNAQAAVSFTAPAVTGGPAITSYTATSSPGGITGSAASSPITVSGLTNGTAYTFTVTATNSIGTGPASAASNSVTPSAVVLDPSFSYVPLLLETTSTNGQNNQGTTTTNGFLDSSTNNFTITRSGSPTQGSVTPYWPNGQWSNYFTTNNYINSTTNSTVFQFGSNPFTIEGWIYQTDRTARQYICGGLFSGPGFQVVIEPSGLIFTGVTGVGDLPAATIAVPANSWTHFAVVRTSTSTNGAAYYINGSPAGVFTISSNISGTASAVNVGTSASVGSIAFNGYISNLRVVNNRAVYSGSFTPPTVPLTATTGGTNPPTGTECTLLTCQSNRFRDNSAQVTPSVFTPSGSPTVQAFQPFSPAAAYTPAAYGGSGYFTGSGYLTAPDNAAFSFGNGDFTVECWIYLTALGTQGIWSNGNSATGSLGFYINAANKLEVGYYGGATVTGATSLTIGTWFHVAVSRSGGTVTRVFLNGVQDATNTSSFNNTSNKCAVGVPFADNTSYLSNGYMSNLRVVKGTAVYTGAFTPPTAPVTNITNTSLLLNFTNAGIYDAAAQNVITTVGDAQVSTAITAKWPPTSIRFDGTGDYLNVSAGSPQSLTFGTGDFTIEFWVYFTSNTGQQVLYDGRSANGAYPLLYTNAGVLTYFVNTSAVITSVQPSTGVWYFMSLRRSSGTTQFFINGTQSGGSYTDSTNYLAPPTSGGRVGANFTGGDFLFGYIQDFRVTKGVARAATPIPTAPFPVQ